MNYLSLENITKTYGEKVLFDNLSLQVTKGQKIALIAKNGSGKSTLLRVVGGHMVLGVTPTYERYTAMAQAGAGWRSALATKTLQDMGMTHVAHIDGGYAAWKKAHAPMVTLEQHKAESASRKGA